MFINQNVDRNSIVTNDFFFFFNTYFSGSLEKNVLLSYDNDKY